MSGNQLLALCAMYNDAMDKHEQCFADNNPHEGADEAIKACHAYDQAKSRFMHDRQTAVVKPYPSHSSSSAASYPHSADLDASLFINQGSNESEQDHSVPFNKVPAILAYGIYKQWMIRRGALLSKPAEMRDETSEMVFYTTALLLVETMVYALRVDERINSEHYQSLHDFCQAVFSNHINYVRGEIDNMLTINLDPVSLANKVRFAEESLDIYLLSAVMLGAANPLEQAYLELLSASLGIDPSARRELDRRAMRMLTSSDEPIDRRFISASVGY